MALLISQLAKQEQQADAVLQSHRQIQVQQNEQRHVAAMLKQDRIQEYVLEVPRLIVLRDFRIR